MVLLKSYKCANPTDVFSVRLHRFSETILNHIQSLNLISIFLVQPEGLIPGNQHQNPFVYVFEGRW